jgi:hypothetical protein
MLFSFSIVFAAVCIFFMLLSEPLRSSREAGSVLTFHHFVGMLELTLSFFA